MINSFKGIKAGDVIWVRQYELPDVQDARVYRMTVTGIRDVGGEAVLCGETQDGIQLEYGEYSIDDSIDLSRDPEELLVSVLQDLWLPEEVTEDMLKKAVSALFSARR